MHTLPLVIPWTPCVPKSYLNLFNSSSPTYKSSGPLDTFALFLPEKKK